MNICIQNDGAFKTKQQMGHWQEQFLHASVKMHVRN